MCDCKSTKKTLEEKKTACVIITFLLLFFPSLLHYALLVVVSRHIKFTFWCCFAYQPDPDDMKCPMFVSQLMLQTILYVHSLFFSQHTQRTYWRSRLGILILGLAVLCILDSLTGNCGTMGGRRRMRTYSSGSENE